MTEYEESKEEFKNGTIEGTRTTRRPVKSNSKDNHGKLPEAKPNLPKIKSEVVAAAGKQRVNARQGLAAKQRVNADLHQDVSEDDSPDE